MVDPRPAGDSPLASRDALPIPLLWSVTHPKIISRNAHSPYVALDPLHEHGTTRFIGHGTTRCWMGRSPRRPKPGAAALLWFCALPDESPAPPPKPRAMVVLWFLHGRALDGAPTSPSTQPNGCASTQPVSVIFILGTVC